MERILALLSKLNFFKKIFSYFWKDNKVYSTTDFNKVSTAPVYSNFNTVFMFYIKNNIDYFLEKVINDLNRNGFFPIIGIEIEFYLSEKYNNSEFYEITKNFCSKNDINILEIDEERGNNQIEIRFDKYTDLNKLIKDYDNLKNFLINNFYAIFSTAPLLHDAFSALQLNINLVDKDNNNLFARNINENNDKVESDLLINSVNGILYTMNILLPLYIKDSNCLKRFNFEKNIDLYNEGKIPAPTFISWGINNRTASIRIPTPKDFTKYEELDKKSRRIEFRVPSSDANIKMCIVGVLLSLVYGIKNNLNIYEKTNFNVLKSNENLKKIYIENTSMLDESVYNFFVEVMQ